MNRVTLVLPRASLVVSLTPNVHAIFDATHRFGKPERIPGLATVVKD
jgi:hypothetical protein